jgi:putative sterol carrier protein
LSAQDVTAVRAQAFLMRKLKIGGSMALALKLQPILDAAAPRAKL